MSEDLADDLARCIVDARFEALEPEAVDAAKKSVLDLLGVTLAASGVEPAAAKVVGLVRESGGAPESTVIGFGDRVPAPWAAFANGVMAHSLDYDDFTPWGSHASSSIVPAAWAIAERAGRVSGRDLIVAVATGQDVFARLLCNVRWRKDWNPSTVFGVFAATAAAARLARLSLDQVANALSIAGLQSSGTMEVVFGIGGDLRGMYAGFSAKSAVLAVLLAQRGIAGPPSYLEGRAGFLTTYFRGDYDRDAMRRGLGRDHLGRTTLYKPWPAVGTAHSHIQATIQLVTRHRLAAEDIDRIALHVGDNQMIMCTPLESRRTPATLTDAKFSLPFLVAVAAIRRDVSISDFTAAGLADARVLATAQKVVPMADSAFDWNGELPLGRVVITTKDGRALDLIGRNVPGSSEAPLSWDRILDKFADCASVAVAPPTPDQVERAQRMARELERLDDATELVRAVGSEVGR
jgi:2-methylcitrate dehydratase PrpD